MSNIILNEDENARDEFSAQEFFKQKQSVICNNYLENKPILRTKSRGILGDITNTNYSRPNIKDDIVILKRKNFELILGNDDKKVKINRVDKKSEPKACFVPYETITSSNYVFDFNLESTSIEPQSDSLSSLNNIYTSSEFVISLSVPAKGYNNKYTNQIAVAEPWRCEKLLKIEHNSAVWQTMFETAKLETRILTLPCRTSCSPLEQYSVTPQLQYMSDCLIKAYHLSSKENDSFKTAIVVDGVNKMSHKYPNQSHCYMPESVNIWHFHELYLEKLPCNKLFDFMPNNKTLSGSILGGFINDLFDLSNHVDLPSEVIHMAVDCIYQYLSRVNNVPLNDLKLIAVGAIWVAAKFEGLKYTKEICVFAHCTQNQLKHAELRLLMVIDINLTKPNAIAFRNRFIIIEASTSIISHISSFILDMALHCYTVMILPASKRAAAALWLSRLIDRFCDVRFDSDDDSLCERLESVWPEHYHNLTGYHHSEISQLAIKMHVIVLALLYQGENNNPSVSACYHKYSKDTYKNLTSSYEMFTSRIVLEGTELYCRVHHLSKSDWLERNELESLELSLCHSVADTRQYNSDPITRDRATIRDGNSCPELLSQSLVRCQQSSKLVKLDSGYGTRSNFSIPTSP